MQSLGFSAYKYSDHLQAQMLPKELQKYTKDWSLFLQHEGPDSQTMY